MAYTPTDEQLQIVDAFRTGGSMVIEAGAGAGKTSTLKLLAADAPKQKGVYIAYNRAIADEAKATFPGNVTARTAHSFAFGPFGTKYKHRLNGPRVTARDAVNILGIKQGFPLLDGAGTMAAWKVGRLALDTVARFCYSADQSIKAKHVPHLPGLEKQRNELCDYVVPFATKAWLDICSTSGRLRFTHDHYLKMWALSEPRLSCDYLLLDEAQDANPLIAAVVEAQDHAQKIMVGDSAQQIYEWRGAVDAMSKFDADHRLTLSQSFRFGQPIADQANLWLDLLNAPLRLIGYEGIESKVEDLDEPMAVLCRTNAEAVARAMEAQHNGRRVALVGGTGEIKRFAQAAIELQAGQGTAHPELVAFKTWQGVKEYVEQDEGGTDLKVFVRLIDSYGPQTVIEVCDATVEEKDADVVVSTAHKSKGREWDTVKLAGDFFQPKEDDDPTKAKGESRLCYVSCTRARNVLDVGSTGWINDLAR